MSCPGSDSSFREIIAAQCRGGRFVGMVLAAVVVLLAACDDIRPRAQILVQRTYLTPGQKVLDYSLQSRRALFTRDESGWRRLLLAFPLPGSDASHATYAVFVQFRDHQPGHSFGPGCEAQAAFIHLARRAGEFRRVSLATTGELQTQPRGGGGGSRAMAGQIRFSTPDGLTVSGPFVATFAPDLVLAFEQDYVTPQIVRPKATDPPPPVVPGRPFDLARLRWIATRPDGVRFTARPPRRRATIPPTRTAAERIRPGRPSGWRSSGSAPKSLRANSSPPICPPIDTGVRWSGGGIDK